MCKIASSSCVSLFSRHVRLRWGLSRSLWVPSIALTTAKLTFVSCLLKFDNDYTIITFAHMHSLIASTQFKIMSRNNLSLSNICCLTRTFLSIQTFSFIGILLAILFNMMYLFILSTCFPPQPLQLHLNDNKNLASDSSRMFKIKL
jgi:hypothetical protein